MQYGGLVDCYTYHYHLYGLHSSGVIYKVDFCNVEPLNIMGIGWQQQIKIGSKLMQKLQSNMQIQPDFKLQKYSTLQDALLQPQVPLRERCQKWKNISMVTKNIIEKQKIQLNAVDCIEYSGIRILRSLRSTLDEMQKIFFVQGVADQLSKQRYNIEYLMDQPHIFALRSIFEMQMMMNRFEKYPQIKELEERNTQILSEVKKLKKRKHNLKKMISQNRKLQILIEQRIQKME